MTTCTDCDQPIRSLGLCESHYQRARRARATAQRLHDRLDEVQHLLDGGVWPEQAARRNGWSLEAAEQAARRAGRDRLRRTLGAHSKALRNRRLVAA